MNARILLVFLAAFGFGVVQTPIWAEPLSEMPITRPVRDVVATYRIEGPALSLIPGGVQAPVRLSWDAAGQRVRAEVEGRDQVALLDLRSHTAQAIDTNLRIVLPLRLRERDIQPLTFDGLRLTAHGRDLIIGLACNVYAFVSPQGPGEVCLTADGVPLRGFGPVDGKPGRFVALSVSYGPVRPSMFEPPSDYIALGSFQGSSGGARGGLAGLMQRFGNSPELQSLLRNGR